MRPDLILASGSPRRRELLDGLGLAFTVRPAAVDETALADEAPRDHVLRLARDKAARGCRAGELILAADTIVVIDDEILGKPEDAGEAVEMLRRLAGREHTVLTGVALHEADGGRMAAAVESTRVRMAELGAGQIDWYVSTGEPLDKAGSYAIQGLGALFVESVEGSYTNVVGLPLPLTYRLFAALDWDLLAFRAG